MVVVSNVQRPFYNRMTGQLQERPGNVYYHVNTGCLKRRQGIFYGIASAKTSFNSKYVDTSSSSLFAGVWISSLKVCQCSASRTLFKLCLSM